MRIRELPLSEQPDVRLRDVGPGALSDTELLAVLIRVGVSGTDVVQLAQELLIRYGGWSGLLRADHRELCTQRGIGAAKAATLKAALEIGRRLLIAGIDERPQIKSPADVANLLMLEMGHLEQEQLRVVLLDTKNRVQQLATIYVGSVNSAQVRIGEVFRDAVRRNSAALIVAHNHPSNDPTPSPEDILVTRQTVSQFLKRWLAEAVQHKNKRSTFDSYTRIVNLYLVPHIGKLRLDKLTPIHVQTLQNTLLATGLSTRTVQYARAVLRRALGQAVKWDLVNRNVVPLVDAPRVEKHKITPLDEAQARRLLAAATGHRLEAMYRVALSLGLRKGEVLGLRWSDIDWRGRKLSITATVQRIAGRRRSRRPRRPRVPGRCCYPTY